MGMDDERCACHVKGQTQQDNRKLYDDVHWIGKGKSCFSQYVMEWEWMMRCVLVTSMSKVKQKQTKKIVVRLEKARALEKGNRVSVSM